MWEGRQETLWQFPAWELCLGVFWFESKHEWQQRWLSCGGELYDGRMIAPSWSKIWERLSDSFYDGLSMPFPPYARSSCASWRQIGQDEAIVVGAVSEREFLERHAALPRKPVPENDGPKATKAQLQEALRELQELIHAEGGPHPNASREERVAHERERFEKYASEATQKYLNENAQRHAEQAEKDAAFRLIEEVENSIYIDPTIDDPRRWKWLCESLSALTNSPHFDKYPN